MYTSVRDGLVARLMQYRSEERIKAPIIEAYDGRLYFQNGRHRARAALRPGFKVIPVVVYKKNVAEVRELLARIKAQVR